VERRKLNIPSERRARMEAEVVAERSRDEARRLAADEAAKRERMEAVDDAVELLRENGYTVTPPPLIPVYGRFRGDPTWDEYQRNIKEHRGAANAIEDSDG
jgi:hypothetical protein